jgi:hypothetical protein
MSENSEFSLNIRNSRVQDWDLVLGPIPFELEKHCEKDEDYQLAYKEAKRRYLIQLANKKVREDAAKGLFDGQHFKISEMIPKTQNRGRMITVSLPEGDISSQVTSINKKLFKMKFLGKGTKWVFEQRGTDDQTKNTGLHIHIVAPRTKKYPNEIIRDMSTQLSVAQNFINIIDVVMEDADKYLLGEKKGAKKQARQVYDDKMRSEFSIEKFYQK